MLISPLTFKEFDATSSIQNKEIRKKPFAVKEEEKVEPPPPPLFSEEELKTAERDGYQRGFLEGKKEGYAQAQSEQAEVERIIMEGLENFINNTSPLFGQYRQHCQQIRQDMPILALSIAQKVSENALSKNFATVIESASKQCADLMISEPEITVTINARLKEVFEHKIKQLATREKNAACIDVTADENIALNDYKIEWKNGSIERSIDVLWQQMDKVIGDMLVTIANETDKQLDLLGVQPPDSQHSEKE